MHMVQEFFLRTTGPLKSTAGSPDGEQVSLAQHVAVCREGGLLGTGHIEYEVWRVT